MPEHNHDHDLIAELASPGGDAERARRLAAECPVCAAELDAQRRIGDALAALGPATLSPSERARLRRAVSPRRFRRWREVAVGAVAVVAVGVGLAGTLGEAPTPGEDADLRSFAATEAAPPTEGAPPTERLDLGGVTSAELDATLSRLVAGEPPPAAADTAGGAGSAPAAGKSAVECQSPGPAVVTVTAIVDGRPLVAFVTTEPGGRRAVIVDATTCEEIDPGA